MSGGAIGALVGLLIAAGLGVTLWVRRRLDDAYTRGHHDATADAAAKWIAREQDLQRAAREAERAYQDRAARRASELARLETEPTPADASGVVEGAGVTEADVDALMRPRRPPPILPPPTK